MRQKQVSITCSTTYDNFADAYEVVKLPVPNTPAIPKVKISSCWNTTNEKANTPTASKNCCIYTPAAKNVVHKLPQHQHQNRCCSCCKTRRICDGSVRKSKSKTCCFMLLKEIEQEEPVQQPILL
jgi:hypothetical protein